MLLRSCTLMCFLFLLKTTTINGEDDKNATSPRQLQDSYMAALANSRKTAKADKGVVYVTANSNQQPSKTNPPIRREDSSHDTGPYAEPTGYSSYAAQDSSANSYYPQNDNALADSYLPQNNYGPPKKYGPPSQHYGAPHHAYGAPSHSYGHPNPMYGPPKPVYGVPYEAPSFFDKFDFKFDLITLAKILLKVVIFKKIVKFIAIVCLLMFIPKLIHLKKGKEDDEEERTVSVSSKEGKMSERINILATFLRQAVETYSVQEKGCEDVGCRVKRVLDDVDDNYTFPSMVEMFRTRDD
ncbi:uncharacterized protein LOC143917316 [Arctopsyche grandis]|uniref:uncharacterized protein LOC143917316 n=1 Tax=Arctopsyche grandis TaxID=121162 RepID=UPI00406D756E